MLQESIGGAAIPEFDRVVAAGGGNRVTFRMKLDPVRVSEHQAIGELNGYHCYLHVYSGHLNHETRRFRVSCFLCFKHEPENKQANFFQTHELAYENTKIILSFVLQKCTHLIFIFNFENC